MDFKHSDKYRKLGLNIAYYRKDRGFTQERVAEQLDIDRTTIGKIETASSGVSVDLLFDLADLFEVSVAKFFEFRD